MENKEKEKYYPDVINSLNNIVKIQPSNFFDYIELFIDNNTNTLILRTDLNLVMQTQNTVLMSEKDTVVLTGNEIHGGSGKLYLNPEITSKRGQNV